ncbi:MAG TPA: tRNA pseudouridine(38-40) synthase TruA [Dehalococcoidia bacterium]|nr:tRNA pseudouridine(38-40) synthase TruA [Dehalococcoidia bacterium]
MTSQPESDAARRFALLLEYDGASYAGSQLQADACTVQGVLEDAVAKATGETARIAFAGRTDAGVHARGQVASFVSSTRLEPETLLRALNAWLPEDVAVLDAVETPADFDPRRHARRRYYRYVIENRAVKPALGRARVWHVATPLDVETMACAAQRLIGRRDFAAFASRFEDEDASTVRELFCFDVRRQGDEVVCDVVADAFLPHQVRRMVGALVDVGKGKRGVDEYAALLEGAPASVGPAAPPYALYLMGVEYEPPLFNLQVALDSESKL